MKHNSQISKEDFEALLNWFSADSEEAGNLYEEIRRGLARFFRYRGCADSLLLADETINRVTLKLNSLDLSKNNKKISIFYGFALNVYREYVRQTKQREVQLFNDIPLEAEKVTFIDGQTDNEHFCLDACLAKLSENDKNLILRYYSQEKAAKIELRKKLAVEQNIAINTLHIKVFRLKNHLRKCIEKCQKKKKL
jgi:DNA-directed RNA polymerase specialized sigma24 family protein